MSQWCHSDVIRVISCWAWRQIFTLFSHALQTGHVGYERCGHLPVTSDQKKNAIALHYGKCCLAFLLSGTELFCCFNLQNLNKYRTWAKNLTIRLNRFNSQLQVHRGVFVQIARGTKLLNLLFRFWWASSDHCRAWCVRPGTGFVNSAALLHHRFFSIIS